MNLNKLMKQAEKMQEQMAKVQADLEEKTVEVQAGGGKVALAIGVSFRCGPRSNCIGTATGAAGDADAVFLGHDRQTGADFR